MSRWSHALFVQGCILNLGVVKGGPRVTRAANGHTRIVQEHRTETLLVFVIYTWNRHLND